MNIYVASSWRNEIQQDVVGYLRENGYEVYDFKNPKPGDNGFRWSEIDPEWKNWTPVQFRSGLDHPIAAQGFGQDMAALDKCDICVLVLPCGRSAHLEAGYAMGAGKPVIIYIPGDSVDIEPELMYKITPFICIDIEEVVSLLRLMNQI